MTESNAKIAPTPETVRFSDDDEMRNQTVAGVCHASFSSASTFTPRIHR
jgi:hypothetical protein